MPPPSQEPIMINQRIALVAAVLSAAATLSVAPSAFADEAAPDTAGGRYMFSKNADGFVRLDMQTGEVAQCSQREVGFACIAAPEDRAVLENEIARLRSENAELKKDLLARGLPLPAGSMPEPLAQNGEPSVQSPSDADIDRVMAFVGRVWHRFVDAVNRAQKQVFNKS
jgi:hypothetical protein